MTNDPKKNSLSDLIRGNATPEVKLRVLDERLQERRNKQQHELNDKWVSCCLTADRRMVQYITQVVLLASTMGFCIAKLTVLDSCESHPYLGLLTLILGVFIPSPSPKSSL